MKTILVIVCTGLSAFFLFYVPMLSKKQEERPAKVEPRQERCPKCFHGYASRAAPKTPAKCTHQTEP